MLETLDIKAQLRALGAARLSELVGTERLSAIEAILGSGVNPTKMVNLLEIRHGTQILSVPKIRIALIANLPNNYIRYVLDNNPDSATLLAEDINRIENLQWRRQSDAIERLIEIFDLPDTYFPQPTRALPAVESIEPEFYLFPHQRRVKDQAIRRLSSDTKALLIHLPTGAGKTRIASEVIVDYVRSYAKRSGFVVWLAHSEELCEQAVETIGKIWHAHGDSRLNIYRLWGRQPVPEITNDGGVIVASLQRIHAMRTTRNNDVFTAINEIHRRCALVLVDEAHKAIAPTYQDGIEFICDRKTSKLVGLTATPGRGFDEDENAELVKFFEGNKLTITDEDGLPLKDPIGFLQSQQFLSRITRRKVLTEVDLDLSQAERKYLATYLDVPPAVLSRLAGDAGRNACILLELTNLVQSGKQVIVFACSVDHAHLLTELCMLRAIEARCIEGNTESNTRARYIEAYKHSSVQVLINFGVLTTGFDAPNTNAILIARPTASIVLYSQMIGRGIRGPLVGGNEECLLIDLEDNLIGFPKEQQAFRYFDNYWN
jgi:DNA repair protein RadD